MFLQGDALTTLKDINNETVDCIITSPPYWALRDYKVEGQIGQEKTINEYVNHLIQIFNECKRVLKKEGTCWIVLGDTYSAVHTGGYKSIKSTVGANRPEAQEFKQNKQTNYPDKTLCMIPERFAIKMIDNGWILRNKIIWYKPNCMPSSATDRFTVDYEYIYFFVKSKKYYFKTQYEPLADSTNEVYERIQEGTTAIKRFGGVNKYKNWKENPMYSGKPYNPNDKGRIKRTVWKISPKPFPEAHFAVFPEELVKQCLDAGCPSEICVKCNKPRKEIVKIIDKIPGQWSNRTETETGHPKMIYNVVRENQGLSDCGCKIGFKQGIILDPFSGAGTTALVATKNNRQFIGIELNPDYIQISKKRLEPYIKQTLLPKFISS